MKRDVGRLRKRGVDWAAAVGLAALVGCGGQAERPVLTAGEWREFEGSWSSAGTRRTMSLGDGRTGSIIDLRGTVLLSGEGSPGVGFRADVIALNDSATGLVGRSVWTDEHGDRVFSELAGEGTAESNRIVGTIVGGTGRYDGVNGRFEFSWQYVIESAEGSVHGRAVGLRGRFRLGGPTGAGSDQ